MAALKRVGRQRTQFQYCYYEGYLEKRSFKDKASRKLWTCLCGNTLFFYHNSKDSDYAEKLDLTDFISLKDDCSRDRNLDAARLNLHMKDGEIKLTAPSLEARELWKGFIYSVVELSVPSSLNLLPGQIHMMRETVEREKERLKDLSAPPVPAPSPNLHLSLEKMPACYQAVSRSEAEIMLERNPGKGNLLLRPGRDGVSLAVTTYQDLNGPVFRHYRVTRKHDGGFVIDVENPIPCPTLYDVINCLVVKTDRALTPFIMEAPYEESIMFVQSNEENGERSLQCASSSPIPPASTHVSTHASTHASTPASIPASTPIHAPVLPPRPGRLDPNQVLPDPFTTPRPCQQTSDLGQRPPTQESELETGESLYLNDQQANETDEAARPTFCPPVRPSTLQQGALPQNAGLKRTALKPPGMRPTPAPRLFTSSSSSSSSLTNSTKETPETRMRRLTVASVPEDTLAQTISKELREKLEARRVLQE